MELFNNKCQDEGKYYLIKTKFRIWERGSILRIMGSIIYDCDSKSYEIFVESIPTDWIEIPESEGKSLLLLPLDKRVNTYTSSVKKKTESLNVEKCDNKNSSISTVENYLITEGYVKYPSGSIFEVNDNTFRDCDKKDQGILEYGIPKSWIKISNEDKRFLLTKKKTERVALFTKKYQSGCSSNTTAAPASLPMYPASTLQKKSSSTTIQEKEPNEKYALLVPIDYASPHIDNTTKETNYWKCQPYPPYKPIFTPAELKLFQSLPNAMRGVSFNTEEEYIDRVNEFFESNPIEINQRGLPSEPIKRDIKANNEYFELTIVQPSSVSDIKSLTFATEWCIGTKVWFRLAESYDKYEGSLQWIGSINSVNVAVVELDNLKVSDRILAHRCTLDLCSKLDIHVFKPSVIVLMSSLQSCSSKHGIMEKHFSKMFGSLINSELSVEIFKDALMLNSKEFTRSLINNCPPENLVDFCLHIMSISISNENKDLLLEMIQNMTISKNTKLLKLAKCLLIAKNDNLFKLLLDKCADKNVVLENGETFLTELLKSNTGEKAVNNVLKMKLFDVNKTNNKNESPLTLACGRIFVATVRCLVAQNCSVDHDNYKAMDILFAAKKTASNMDQMKKVIEIIEILNEKPKSDTNICSICMDRKITIVFGCGHTCCKECSERLIICPMCSRRIASKITIFLD